MREALGSYTPRVLPLDYDSLEADYGCQNISGTPFSSLEPFARLCNFDPDIFVAAQFDQPDTVFYFAGPEAPDTPPPFHETWAVWVGKTGVRVGKYTDIVPPDNSRGELSSLYPSTKPTKVSAAFDGAGLLNIAIQKSPATIEIKRYITTTEIATVSFTGESPVMIFTGLVYHSNIPNQEDVGCLYLRAERPNTLFVRLLSEAYATEHELHFELPVKMARLAQLSAVGETLVLWGQNSQGADTRLTSNPYSVQILGDATSLNTELSAIRYFDAAVTQALDTEEASLTSKLDNITYFKTVVPATDNPLPEESATLSSALTLIEYV